MKKHHNFEVEEFKQNPDWFLIFACGFLIGFGLFALIALV